MQNTYHEKETIRLASGADCSLVDLQEYLLSRGYSVEDDFYFLDRADVPKPWQSISVITVNVLKNGEALNHLNFDDIENEATWDELKIEYLLATLPPHLIGSACNECESIAERFNLTMSFEGRQLNSVELRVMLNDIATSLTAEWSEPGSETLAILIQDLYN